jgi:hypothetical protein
MKLIANSLNAQYLSAIVKNIDKSRLEGVNAAVAYTTTVDEISELARETNVPFVLYTLIDGDFPSSGVVRKFLEGSIHWQLLVTRDFFHSEVSVRPWQVRATVQAFEMIALDFDLDLLHRVVALRPGNADRSETGHRWRRGRGHDAQFPAPMQSCTSTRRFALLMNRYIAC